MQKREGESSETEKETKPKPFKQKQKITSMVYYPQKCKREMQRVAKQREKLFRVSFAEKMEANNERKPCM